MNVVIRIVATLLTSVVAWMGVMGSAAAVPAPAISGDHPASLTYSERPTQAWTD